MSITREQAIESINNAFQPAIDDATKHHDYVILNHLLWGRFLARMNAVKVQNYVNTNHTGTIDPTNILQLILQALAAILPTLFPSNSPFAMIIMAILAALGIK